MKPGCLSEHKRSVSLPGPHRHAVSVEAIQSEPSFHAHPTLSMIFLDYLH